MLPGAKPAPFPGFIEPCIPTLGSAVPAGSGWLYEIKFDGYRVQLRLNDGRPSILTRGGYDWTGRFAPIARALATWPANDLILDEAGGGSCQRTDDCPSHWQLYGASHPGSSSRARAAASRLRRGFADDKTEK
jgi:hypothetical protein